MPEFNVTKILLDAAHDADAVYRYFLKEGITPFIDLNKGNTGKRIYMDTFTVNADGVPVYKMSRPNVQKILYKNVQLVCLF